jgi:hypothetical protein
MNRPAYWIASLLFVVLVLAKFSPQTGFTSLIRFGETWQDHRLSALSTLPLATVPKSNGYDGQFYAQIALDPLLRSAELEHVLDAPPYRARRILVPATASLLGLGNPWRTLQAYALLNVVCWFAFGWLLRDCLGTRDWVSFARWAGCMFSMGALESVRQSLVDLPALLLLSFAIRTYAQSRAVHPTLWLTLGNLAKETTLLGTLALNSDGLVNKLRLRRTLLSIFVAVVPLGLWSLYVHQRFSGSITNLVAYLAAKIWALYDNQHFSGSPAGEGLGNFSWPLLGLFNEAKLCIHELLNGNLDGRYAFGLLAIGGLLTQAVTLWRTPQFQLPWWRVGAAYSLFLPFLGLWVWSGYWAACRVLLPMTIAFNLLLPSNRSFWPLWIAGNLTLLHAVWRFV